MTAVARFVFDDEDLKWEPLDMTMRAKLASHDAVRWAAGSRLVL